jgi:hypothetical protein
MLPEAERIVKLINGAIAAVNAVLAFDSEAGNPNANKPYSQRSMMCNYSVGKYYEEIFGPAPDYLVQTVYSPTRKDYVLANTWYQRIPQHPEEWTLIEGNANTTASLDAWMTAVQAKADAGYFVVCVADGSPGRGHIVVVIPSPDGQRVAGGWTVDTPHTIDCGSGKRENHTDLSVSFENQTKWQNRIKFYYHN